MTYKHSLLLLALAALWGSSFLFMRTAAPEFGPYALVAIRTGLASLFLLPLIFFRRGMTELYRYKFEIMMVGLTNTAIPFCLFSYSAIYLDASFSAILNAMAPIFGALISWLCLKEALPPSAIVGLLLGFCGVTVISSGAMSSAQSASFIPILSALGATLFYGIAACYTRVYLMGTKPMVVATGSQIFATVFVLPFALFNLPAQMPSVMAWTHTLILGIFGTGVAYIMYFYLIANIGAARAMTVAYLVPVFGVLWGVIFLHERLSTLSLTGAALILVGVSLTTGLFSRHSRQTDR